MILKPETSFFSSNHYCNLTFETCSIRNTIIPSAAVYLLWFYWVNSKTNSSSKKGGNKIKCKIPLLHLDKLLQRWVNLCALTIGLKQQEIYSKRKGRDKFAIPKEPPSHDSVYSDTKWKSDTVHSMCSSIHNNCKDGVCQTWSQGKPGIKHKFSESQPIALAINYAAFFDIVYNEA